MKNYKLITGIVICTLLIIALVIFKKTVSTNDPSSETITSKAQQTQNRAVSKHAREARSASRHQNTARNKAAEKKPTHTPEQLVEFIIPNLSIVDLTFKQALYRLNSEYRNICIQTGEIPIPLKFNILDERSQLINVTIENSSIMSAIKHLSIIAGMEMTQDEDTLTFQLMELEGKVAKHSLIFAQGSHSSPNPRKLMEDLAIRGEHQMSYLAVTNSVLFQGDPTEIKRLTDYFERNRTRMHDRIKASTTHVKSSADFDSILETKLQDGMTLSQTEFQDILTALRQAQIEIHNLTNVLIGPNETWPLQINGGDQNIIFSAKKSGLSIVSSKTVELGSSSDSKKVNSHHIIDKESDVAYTYYIDQEGGKNHLFTTCRKNTPVH